MSTIPPIPTVRDRIIASAEALYSAAGRSNDLPTVGAVRRHSKTGMSECCDVMQEWRRAQTIAASTPEVQIPDRLSQACASLVRDVWKEAQAFANESLNLAQSSWDKARAEMIQIRKEASDDFEIEKATNDTLVLKITALQEIIENNTRASADAIFEEQKQLAGLREQTQSAILTAAETEKRVCDLKSTLVEERRRSHSLESELRSQREELLRTRQHVECQAVEITKLTAENSVHVEGRLVDVERLRLSEINLAEALTLAGAAREIAAHLRGKYEGVESQRRLRRNSIRNKERE